jgi:hypothetical protein
LLSAAGNTISDGSFETPGLSAGTYQCAPNGSPWQFGGCAGVSSYGSAFTSGNPMAPDGTQVAYIQRGGSMSQSVYLSAGTYSISMQAAQRASQVHYQQIAVLVDGARVGTVTPADIAYRSYQTPNFTVAVGTHTIAFVGLNPRGGGNTAFLDKVAISAVTSVTDGSFESPGLPAGTYRCAPDGSPWQFGGSAGVSSYSSAFTSGNSLAPDGSQVAYIQRNGSISQSVYLYAGTYNLSMEAAQRASNAHCQEFEVLVDGANVAMVTPAGISYASYQTSNFTVATGMHAVQFVGLNPKGGGNTAFIDEVTIDDADFIGDGSFEQPALSAGTFQYSPTGSPWQFGTGTGVSSNGSVITSGNPKAPDGSQVAFIQGGGSISQTVYLAAGAYNLSMEAAQQASQTSSQEIQVLVDGAQVGTVTPAGTSYGLYQTSNFTVAAGTHTIQFTGLTPTGSSGTAFLDEVAIINAAFIADGSFEQPGLAAGAYQCAPGGSSWQFGGSAGISSNNSAFTCSNFNAPDGSQVGYIQRGGSISQSVYLYSGTYNLSLEAAQRASQVYYQEIEVLVDGANVGTITPTSIKYASYQTTNFTVTTGKHTIEFLGLNPRGGGNTAFIDEVALTEES